MRVWALIGIGSCVASTALAQAMPAVGRAIELPDTGGANFAIGDSATRAGTPTDFDFLIGVWEFQFQSRRQDGTLNKPFSGHWFVTKKDDRVDGGARLSGADSNLPKTGFIEDHFRPDNAAAPYDAGTWTYRVFNPSRKLWEMQGTDAGEGGWAPGLCWSDAHNRYLVQRYGPNIMRIRYFAIADTSFLWRADRSRDGGATWIPDWWTMKSRRIAR